MVFQNASPFPTALAVAPAAPGRQPQRELQASSLLALTGLTALGLGHAWAVPLLLSPVLEEVVFRLGVHDALLGWRRSRGAGVLRLQPAVATAAAFAAVHFLVRPGFATALTFVPALAIGAAYEHRRALLPCVALHATFNAIWWLGAGRVS